MDTTQHHSKFNVRPNLMRAKAGAVADHHDFRGIFC
jgi:hypothetical protein